MKEIRIFCHLLFIFSSFSSSFQNENLLSSSTSSSQNKNLFLSQILERLKLYKSFSESHLLHFSDFTQKIYNFFESSLDKNEISSNSNFFNQLFPLIKNYVPSPLPINNMIKQKRATIHSPLTTSSLPIKFSPIFPFRVKLKASIENVSNPSNLKILVIFPDDKARFFSFSFFSFIFI